MFKKQLTFGKVLVFLLVAFLVALALYSVSVIIDFVKIFDDDCLSENEIVKVVKENYQVILDDIAERNFSDSEKIKGIQKITVVGDAIDFDCGGKGFGPATSYFGFYYTPNDKPRNVWSGTLFSDIEDLTPDGDGFYIKENDGDNLYYTEKLADFFYRYEAYF